MRFAAVLSDLDGVLVDTGAAVERVWREWAAGHGLDPDAVAIAGHGVPAREVIPRVAPHLPVAEEAERVERLHIAAPGAALPGAAELLALTEPRVAVVTSGGDALAHSRLESAGLPFPEVLVTADQVARGKPSPDAYLLAAERLGVPPHACLVIEDAPFGVRAGRAAGMTVWAVTTTHAPGELDGAERTFADVAEALRQL